MATQVAKVEEEKQPSELQQRVSGSLQNTTEFFHDVRVELKKVTWPSREDVTSTTGVVIATVAFFGVYLAIVEWLAQKGLDYILKVFRACRIRATFSLKWISTKTPGTSCATRRASPVSLAPPLRLLRSAKRKWKPSSTACTRRRIGRSPRLCTNATSRSASWTARLPISTARSRKLTATTAV